MPYDIRLENAPAHPLAVIRRKAAPHELSKVIPDSCGIVWNAVKALNLKGGRLVAIYSDNQINLEVGVEIDTPFTPRGNLFPSATPAGLVATATLIGPYSEIPAAHQALRQWCTDHHHTPSGINWEIYAHPGPEFTQPRTDISYLLHS